VMLFYPAETFSIGQDLPCASGQLVNQFA
jgi:hypothetical protein